MVEILRERIARQKAVRIRNLGLGMEQTWGSVRDKILSQEGVRHVHWESIMIDPLRIGHRGAAGHAPENTLLSMQKGIELGVDFLELDVQRTADNQIVVLHDKRVDRTTNGSGYVSQLTFDEIRRLDAGAGQKIPLLEEVLDLADGRAGLMIELKDENIAHAVISTVRGSRFGGPVIYASFLHKELLAVNSLDGNLQTLALIEAIPVNSLDFVLDSRATHVGLGFDSARREFINELQLAGKPVFVYTLNDRRDIICAQGWGVDGIISDYPERIPKRSNAQGEGLSLGDPIMRKNDKQELH